MKVKEIIKEDEKLVLLSLREEYYNEMLEGTKKFEYRKKYNKYPTKAFIYISKTLKKIVAIIDFDKPVYDSAENIAQISEKEKENSFNDMIEYIGEENSGYAIPIKKITKIENITLEQLKEKINKFTVPQSFFYVNDKPELLEVLENLEIQD